MRKRSRRWIEQHPVAAYFMLAYLFSWSVGALLIAGYHDLLPVPGAVHYLVSFGPALAAVTVTAVTSGRRGLAELLARVTRWRTWWVLIGLLSPLVLAGLAVVANALWIAAPTERVPDLAALGQIPYLGDIGIGAALLLWIATFGLGEEIGWRGFAQPHLQQKQGLLRAALVIGLFWAGWHLPAFFYKPNFIALGVGGFVGFAIGVVAGAVLLAWLYNRSGGSILVVALWHAVFDFTTSTAVAEGAIAAITSTLVMVWALAITVRIIWRHDQPVGASPVPANISGEGSQVMTENPPLTRK